MTSDKPRLYDNTKSKEIMKYTGYVLNSNFAKYIYL